MSYNKEELKEYLKSKSNDAMVCSVNSLFKFSDVGNEDFVITEKDGLIVVLGVDSGKVYKFLTCKNVKSVSRLYIIRGF